MALRWSRPSQSGPRAKLIAHSWPRARNFGRLWEFAWPLRWCVYQLWTTILSILFFTKQLATTAARWCPQHSRLHVRHREKWYDEKFTFITADVCDWHKRTSIGQQDKTVSKWGTNKTQFVPSNNTSPTKILFWAVSVTTCNSTKFSVSGFSELWSDTRQTSLHRSKTATNTRVVSPEGLYAKTKKWPYRR